MDKLFWGKEFEDILDWTKRLKMAYEVQGYDEVKLCKIVKLNLRCKVRDWFKKLQLVLAYWIEMKTNMHWKFGVVDLDELRVKMDSVKEEPMQQVQLYFEKLDKLFGRGKIKDDEQKRHFLAHL
jgi:hypothetical protein